MKNLNEYDLSKASDVMNFNREVVNIINDNLRYMKEVYDEITAESCYDYFALNSEIEGYQLSEAHKQQFLFVANNVLHSLNFMHKRNGNKELEIEVTEFVTEIPSIDVLKNDALQGWSGSAKIEGKLFTGDFKMLETYTIDGIDYEINWSEFL